MGEAFYQKASLLLNIEKANPKPTTEIFSSFMIQRFWPLHTHMMLKLHSGLQLQESWMIWFYGDAHDNYPEAL